jgi:hypothetical protein
MPDGCSQCCEEAEAKAETGALLVDAGKCSHRMAAEVPLLQQQAIAFESVVLLKTPVQASDNNITGIYAILVPAGFPSTLVSLRKLLESVYFGISLLKLETASMLAFLSSQSVAAR